MEANLFNQENGTLINMNISIVLSTQPASFSALAYKGEIEENISKIKSLGYDGVELAVRNPELLDVEYISSLTSTDCLPVPAIGTGQAYGEEGLSFTHENPDIRRQAIERIKSHIRFADRLNAVVIIGLIRGKSENENNISEAEDYLIQALKECAGDNGSVNLAIEPINRYETNLINTVESGLDIIEKVGMENVGLLLDTFHMNIEEPSIIESIKIAKDRLFHFHIADSNRWYPGAGHIDFNKIIETLDLIGYKNFVSAEIMPYPDPDIAAEKTIEHMQEIFNCT